MKKTWLFQVCAICASLVLMLTESGVCTTCSWLWHQPKLPPQLEKLRKDK